MTRTPQRRTSSTLVTLLAAVVLAAGAARLALAADEEPESCLDCHAEGASRDGAPAGLRVDAGAFRRSVHAKSCVGCHEDKEEFPHAKAPPAEVACANCHEASAEKFAATPHGKLAKDGARKGPGCASCHPPHAVLPAKDPASSLHKTKLPETCGPCHAGAQPEGVARVPRTVDHYARSVHGVEVLERGNLNAAGCTDCHPVHDLRNGADPASRTFKPNVPKLCGTCHADIAKEYAESIHGTALAAGKLDSPACNDCHTEHAIARPENADSTVAATHVSQTCAACHAAERITRRYGLPDDRVASYRDSYHGLADLGGSTAVANCASCHGVHGIRPSSDPQSTIHPDRLLDTCSRCHEGASAGFVEGRVHAAADPEKDRAAYWVRLAYLVLIPATIGGMLLHNGAIFLKYVREKLRAQKASRTYVRFRPYEVAVHAAVAGSFVVLAVTGFALAMPTSGWVQALASLGMTEAVRGWVHRAAAVVFFAGAVAHVLYVIFSPHGRYAFGRIVPRLQDVRDARQNVAYHLGLAPRPPKFDRWDYTMKVEYWALVWGGLVMAATGAVLWFNVGATRWMPRWMVHVAERVHWYEAILAVLAIVVWHLFFVVFHPAEYPMNLTWLTGRKTEHEMEHAHPLELERLRDAERAARPQPPEPADGGAPPAA